MMIRESAQAATGEAALAAREVRGRHSGPAGQLDLLQPQRAGTGDHDDGPIDLRNTAWLAASLARQGRGL
jgi:hypothetical protein